MSPEWTEAAGRSCGAREFATAHWSVVLSARDGPPTAAQAALETLCRTYRIPLQPDRDAERCRGGQPVALLLQSDASFMKRLAAGRAQPANAGSGRLVKGEIGNAVAP